MDILEGLMPEKSATYEPVPSSAGLDEDQQISDYEEEEDFKDEEEAPLLSSRGLKRTTSSWLPFLAFVCISLAGLALKLSFDNQAMSMEPAHLNTLTNSSAATHEHIITFETRGGGAISLYKVQWETNSGHIEDTYVCHLQSICVDRRLGSEAGSIDKRYWLMGRSGKDQEMDSIAPLDKEASDAFRMCLGHSDSEDPSYYLGVKSVRSYNGEVSWVHGSTLGMPQVANASNERSDSLAWLKAWSRFMSLSISATPDFLRKIHLTKRHFFRRVLWLDYPLDFDHWRTTIFRIANSAAYAGLLQPPSDSKEPGLRKLPIRDGDWMDKHAPPQEMWGDDSLGMDEATCFENMILVAPSSQFFRDRADADYFRSWAYNEAGQPQDRPIPQELKDLKVVVLLHSNQPTWNFNGLTDQLIRNGIHNIRVGSITDFSSVDAHMDIWSTADIVISDDHDSLTGQTLMRPGSGVFEVFASSIEDDAHKILATKTGIHYTASRLHNWEADVAACKGDAQCVQAIKEQAAIVEDGNLLIGMGDLLRKMGLAHHCKMGASRTSGHKPA